MNLPAIWRCSRNAVAVSCLLAPVCRSPGGEIPPAPQPSPTNLNHIASFQGRVSPVQRFRQLLAMSPPARDRFLTNYPAEKRRQILQKIQEYQSMPPDMRELRLRVTELRWYLLPLLNAPPDQSARLLKSVPEPYHDLIAARLNEWEMWPPDLKSNVLKFADVMHFLVGKGGVPQTQSSVNDLPEPERLGLELKLTDWLAIPEAQRKQMYGCFRHYFDLSPQEQEKILDTLSAPQRQQTEKIVNSMEHWPRAQQEAYLAALRKFTEMTPADRKRFIENARRWQIMTSTERHAWRDFVTRLSSPHPHPPGPTPVLQPVGPAVPPAAHSPTNHGPTPK